MLRSLLLAATLGITAGTAHAQSYTSYFTGDTADVSTNVSSGLCLMGGASENDSAMTWWLKRAGGGDIVVIRAAGADGYNTYLFSDLGIAVNSVESIVFNDASAASDPYVRRRIAEAEAIWIAGGDQSFYVNYWRGTGIDSIINQLVNVKGIPVGGISAGMAVLGWAYYSAVSGSIYSDDALANPYDTMVTVGQNDFLKMPRMHNVITDTHYDNPDRRGRHVVFMSRMLAASGDTVRGIACDEYTAVCIDPSGLARIYGEYPAQNDNAYFLQTNCASAQPPELLAPEQPLSWIQNNEALKVYHVKGVPDGSNTFSLVDWKTGTGGAWENWWVESGELKTGPGTGPDCITSVAGLSNSNDDNPVLIYPNPATEAITIDSPGDAVAMLLSADGRHIASIALRKGGNQYGTAQLAAGIYYLQVNGKTLRLAVK